MALPLAVIWSQVAQQVTSGLAAGAIYASLALALVLIYQTTNVVNFAQGEMATFTTYIAWTIMNHGVAYWPAFVLTLLIAFGGGVDGRARAHPAGRAPAGDRDRDPDDRHVDRDQRAHRLDLGTRGQGVRQPVPQPLRDRRRTSRSRSRTSARSASASAPSPCSGSSSGSRRSGSRCARSRSIRTRAG